jgi:uncharacterized protein
MRKKLLPTLFTLLTLLTLSQGALAQIEKELPARPTPPTLVVDFTGTLAPDQQEALEQKLVAFDDSSSSQVAIVIVETTGDRDIADYAVALGRAWGIGNKEFNNGVLLLIAKNDRKLWIATGYGLEGALPDITAKQIVDEVITPNFRENDFYRGLDEGTDAIVAATRGEYTTPDKYRKKKNEEGVPALLIFIMVFVFIALMTRKNRGGNYDSRGYHGRGPGGIWFLPSGHGGSGGSSSGGGFGGFGGGSFGGGGAGGSW